MQRMMRILMCFPLVALLSGCGLSSNQIVKTQSFGAATADIGKIAEEEFVNIRNGIIEMNMELVSIDNTKTSRGLVFDKPAYADRTAKRVAASKALKLYGELLVKLVTEDRAENLQKTANQLVENTMVALEKDLSEEKKGAINKIIVGFGSFWVEKKKANVIKEIIPAYQQPVNDLADLLSVDFSLDGSLGYLQAYETTAKKLKRAAKKLVDAGNSYSVLERARAVHALVMAEKALTRSTEISKKAKISLDGLKKANAELVKVLGDKEYATDDIKMYAKQIQEFVNMYQVLVK